MEPNIIAAAFDRHQRKASATNTTKVSDHDIQLVRNAVNEYRLANGMEQLDLVHDKKPSNDDLSHIWQHILDCAIANANIASSKRVVELLAAILVDLSDDCVLNRLIQFSKCNTDSVRGLATFMLTQWFNFLLLKESDDHHDLLNTLQQAILPRFTDKAVAVRAETLNIQFADPDLLTAGLFLLQHDPSANNRIIAATRIPVNLQTAEYFVYRIRDVKASVRTTVLAALETAVLDPSQMAQVVLTGYTERCQETSQATARVICKWFQQVHFKVAKLLKLLNIVEYADAAETILKVLHETDTNIVLANELSPAEHQAFQDGLQDCMEVSITDNNVGVEDAFAARVGLGMLKSSRHKESYLAKLIPDIPELCIVLEQRISEIIEMHSQDEVCDESACDRIAMFCDQMLRIGILSDVQEEGTRRVLVDAMKSFLSFVSTPDNLIAPCVETLLRVSRDSSSDLDSIFGVLSQLPQDLQEAATLRTLSIANLALESIAVDVNNVRDLIVHESAVIRQGAVECYGKMGLYRSMDTVRSQQWPLLLQIAQNDNESVAVRSQAALALADYSVLMGTIAVEICVLVSAWLNDKELSGVGSEIAVKLLVSRNKIGDEDTDDSSTKTKWMAMLLLKFFETNSDDEDEDNELEVGSPARLQQLLALYLPNMARLDRERFVGCIQTLLDISPKTTSTKIVEYVVQTALNSPCEKETSSPQLLASIEVASFLWEKASDISKTLLRSLCKLLGNWEFDIENEFYDNLSVLKELLDEMLANDIVEDARAIECIKTCFAKLGEVEMEEEVEDEEEEKEDETNILVYGLEKLNIAAGDENMVETVAAPSMFRAEPVKHGATYASAEEGSLRRSRRFRPSNNSIDSHT